jgi:hypothetical protein
MGEPKLEQSNKQITEMIEITKSGKIRHRGTRVMYAKVKDFRRTLISIEKIAKNHP